MCGGGEGGRAGGLWDGRRVGRVGRGLSRAHSSSARPPPVGPSAPVSGPVSVNDTVSHTTGRCPLPRWCPFLLSRKVPSPPEPQGPYRSPPHPHLHREERPRTSRSRDRPGPTDPAFTVERTIDFGVHRGSVAPSLRRFGPRTPTPSFLRRPGWYTGSHPLPDTSSRAPVNVGMFTLTQSHTHLLKTRTRTTYLLAHTCALSDRRPATP